MDDKAIIGLLEEEIEQLKHELAKARKEKERIDEECDLLAEENERLREQLSKVSSIPSTSHPVKPGDSPSSQKQEGEDDQDNSLIETEALDIFLDDPLNSYVNHCQKEIPNAASGKNVIATCFFTNEEIGHLLFCGGVDALIHGYDYLSGIELYSFKVTAPVLTIDCCQDCIACGMMDGSLFLIFITSVESNPITVSFKEHNKYCICVKWSLPNGEYLVTAGHDKVINLYRNLAIGGGGAVGEIVKYQSIQFTHVPESIAFGPVNTLQPVPTEVIIGLRGIASLIYLHLETFEQRSISLNEKEWDHHVSFTPLYLSVSPNQKYLLIATDKNMHIIVKIGTNERVRVLTGHASGDYGKPIAIWDSTGSYIYCNSEEEHTLYVYSVAKEKVVERLSGHHGIIRGVARHPTKAIVATASYDKSLIVWDHFIH